VNRWLEAFLSLRQAESLKVRVFVRVVVKIEVRSSASLLPIAQLMAINPFIHVSFLNSRANVYPYNRSSGIARNLYRLVSLHLLSGYIDDYTEASVWNLKLLPQAWCHYPKIVRISVVLPAALSKDLGAVALEMEFCFKDSDVARYWWIDHSPRAVFDDECHGPGFYEAMRFDRESCPTWRFTARFQTCKCGRYGYQ